MLLTSWGYARAALLALGLSCGCSAAPQSSSSAQQPPANTSRQPATLLLSHGVDPIGAEAYIYGEHGALYIRCALPIDEVEWDLGGGGTMYEQHPQFAVVQWGEPGHYQGRVRAVAATGIVEATFEYAVVPAVTGVVADSATQDLPFGQPHRISVLTSHPPAAVEWRSTEPGSSPVIATGAETTITYEQYPDASILDVRIGDGLGKWTPWQQEHTYTKIDTRYRLARAHIPSGVVGETVTATLDAKYPFTKVDWHLGDGAERIGGSDGQPQFRLLKSGFHRAGMQPFAGDEPRLAHSPGYFVGDTEPQQWTRLPLPFLSLIRGGSVATVLDGKPVIAGFVWDSSSGKYHLLIAIANQPVPKSESDWHLTQLETPAVEGSVLLQERDEQLQVLYPGETTGTHWASAKVALPAQPSDWTTRTIDVYNPVDLLFLDGRAVVVTNSENLQLVLATVRDPAGPADWREISFPPIIVRDPPLPSYGHSEYSEQGMWAGRLTIKPRPEPIAKLLLIDQHLLVPYTPDHGLAVAVAVKSRPETSADFAHYLLPSKEGHRSIEGFVLQNRLRLLVDGYLESRWYEATKPLPLTAADWHMGRSDHSEIGAFSSVTSDVVNESLTVLAMAHPAHTLLLRGQSGSSHDIQSLSPTYLAGDFQSDTRQVLDTGAGLAILLGSSEGPVLFYPDVPVDQ